MPMWKVELPRKWCRGADRGKTFQVQPPPVQSRPEFAHPSKTSLSLIATDQRVSRDKPWGYDLNPGISLTSDFSPLSSWFRVFTNCRHVIDKVIPKLGQLDTRSLVRRAICSRLPTGIAGFRPSITGKAWGNRRSYRRGFGRQFYFRDLTAGARLNTGSRAGYLHDRLQLLQFWSSVRQQILLSSPRSVAGVTTS
jgi:hypothetical protein